MKFPQQLIALIPNTRILFYADNITFHMFPPNTTPGEKLRHTKWEFGLSTLAEAIQHPFVNIDFKNRYWNLKSINDIDVDANGTVSSSTLIKPTLARITPEILKNYDQLWLFGHHMISGQEIQFGINTQWYPDNPEDPNNLYAQDYYGFEESSFNSAEIDAIKQWMNKGGGLLILGDHSSPYGMKDDVIPSVTTNNWFNLGRALGFDIPRGGQMRVWEGPKGASSTNLDNFQTGEVINTSGDDSGMRLMPNQEDNIPQEISPTFFSTGPLPRAGFPDTGSPQGYYHPLMMGHRSSNFPDGIIRVMPDHGHEGSLNTFYGLDDETVWPKTSLGFQPRPIIIAYGTNKVSPFNGLPLISAYDGHTVGVGRIVAQSTWHHFVNVNLHGFLTPEASEIWTQISQYFINLTSWLSSAKKRIDIVFVILNWLATSRIFYPIRGASAQVIGKVAIEILSDFLSTGQILDIAILALDQVSEPSFNHHISIQRFPLSLENIIGSLVIEAQSQSKECPLNGIELLKRGAHKAICTRLKELELEERVLREMCDMNEGK